MIPTFLHSVAAQVRTLVREGKALHVSDKTADELELVAGLDWGAAERACAHINQDRAPVAAGVVYLITPADIAWAWLKLSRAQPSREWVQHEQDVIAAERIQDDDAKRAAECAELATIASRIDVPNGQSIELDGEELRLCSPVNPHEGTRDGARAAWGHIQANIPTTDDERWERYCRELEAL